MADPASIADEGPAGEVDDGVEAVEVEAPAKTAFEPVAKKDAKDLFPMASAVEAIGEASRALVLNWPVLHTVVGEMWDGGGGSDGIVAVLIESVFFFFFFFFFFGFACVRSCLDTSNHANGLNPNKRAQ